MARPLIIENTSTKALRKWIYMLHKIKNRLERYKLDDIRCYFENQVNKVLENRNKYELEK